MREQASSVLSLPEAAAYLQVSKAHLSNVINGKVRGVTPMRFVRMGRRILLKKEWIDQWLETERKGGPLGVKIDPSLTKHAVDA